MPANCLIHAAHALDVDDESDETSSCSSDEDMTEEERILFLEARDLFVNEELEHISKLPDEDPQVVQSCATVIYFVNPWVVDAVDESTERQEPEEVSQLIAHAQMQTPDDAGEVIACGPTEDMSVKEARQKTDEEIFTTFILSLSENELEDFLNGQIDEETSSPSEVKSSSSRMDSESPQASMEVFTPPE